MGWRLPKPKKLEIPDIIFENLTNNDLENILENLCRNTVDLFHKIESLCEPNNKFPHKFYLHQPTIDNIYDRNIEYKKIFNNIFDNIRQKYYRQLFIKILIMYIKDIYNDFPLGVIDTVYEINICLINIIAILKKQKS